MAEHWLVAQEPYLLSQELGHAIDEVEQLIKKHEAFEKSAAAQEERFAALERLTTVSAWCSVRCSLLPAGGASFSRTEPAILLSRRARGSRPSPFT